MGKCTSAPKDQPERHASRTTQKHRLLDPAHLNEQSPVEICNDIIKEESASSSKQINPFWKTDVVSFEDSVVSRLHNISRRDTLLVYGYWREQPDILLLGEMVEYIIIYLFLDDSLFTVGMELDYRAQNGVWYEAIILAHKRKGDPLEDDDDEMNDATCIITDDQEAVIVIYNKYEGMEQGTCNEWVGIDPSETGNICRCLSTACKTHFQLENDGLQKIHRLAPHKTRSRRNSLRSDLA